MSERKIHWRCFHCGDAFTKAQERWAREHFGSDQDALPVCQMRLPGEQHLLTALRNAQAELAGYRAEDSDLMRAIYAMSADHAQALRREEELGYARGVRDARQELEHSGAQSRHCPDYVGGQNAQIPAAQGIACDPPTVL